MNSLSSLPKVGFATNNQRKKDINVELFGKKDVGVQILGYSDLGIESPVEDGETIMDNAMIKFNTLATSVTGQVNQILDEQEFFPIFANDSGIKIDFFDGFGAESRRDEEGNYLDDAGVAERICKVARSLPESQRTAHVISCYVTGIHGQENPLRVNQSKQSGIILEQPSKIIVPNMPFNSVFVPNGFNKPLSELTPEEFERWILNEYSFVKNIEVIKRVIATKVRVNRVFTGKN